ncbi:mediator of RNA polymerase II transcription subunit 30-like isoform X1 [Uloborus diversus]|uniref:mediator of RNA polymerase II transcription subunit 30-like isoform X1 n=2 Tax=Uloborus diversus TaxID=327109 RepID=UPI0024092FD9|nr:mediator of RNA polymerase II transcription subunit 30-like isoform X1 [Uloborus diversus]
MTSFQGATRVPPGLPSDQNPYPGTQSLDIGPNSAMGPVGVQENQDSMENSSGMNQGGSQQPPQLRDINRALLCRLGQETVQDIVVKTTEVFQMLKILQPPNGTTQSLASQEERRQKLQDQINLVNTLFKKLRRVYEKCNENCATMEYSHVEVDSLVPLKDEVDSRQEDKKTSEAMKQYTEEYNDLVEQVMMKNRQIKEIIDHLRSFVWDINTMLATSKT